MKRFSNSKVLKSVLCAAALAGCATDAQSDDAASETLAQTVIGTDRADDGWSDDGWGDEGWEDDGAVDDGWGRERDNDDERTRRPQRPRVPSAPEAVFIRVKRPNWDRSDSVRVLDVAGWSRQDRGPVQLWTASNGEDNANQQWRVYPRGDSFVIQNVFSGKCLDETLETPQVNGREVYQYTCDSRKPNQRWEFVGRRGGFGALRNRQSGRCLDVTNLEYRDGAKLQVWDCTGAWNQSWNIW